MIRLEGVSKTYLAARGEPVEALRDINIEIGEREFITIVGPSGCGKSTLLKLIVGILPLSSGKIYFDGTEVEGPRNDVGMVFQQPILLPWRTIFENVMFPIEILHRQKADYRNEAQNLLDLVGLGEFYDHSPWELSGGMQQRVSICRALIHEPQLLVMDEPFGALDAMTREEMGVELLRVWRDRQKTVLFVTHSIRESILLADRVVVMSPRPGEIAKIININLPRPRHEEMEFLPEFELNVKVIKDLIYQNKQVVIDG